MKKSSHCFVRIVLAASLFFLFSPVSPAFAMTVTNTPNYVQRFGLGIILGEPSALTGKYFLTKNAAVDVGVSFGVGNYFLVYSDYLYRVLGVFGQTDAFVSHLAPYFGVGGVFVIATSTRDNDDGLLGTKQGQMGLGVRVPVGLEWKGHAPSIGIFVELVPGLAIIPQTTPIFEAGVGIRYYF